MITVGNWDVVTSKTLLIPAGQNATITVDVDGWRLRINVIISRTDKSANAERYLNIKAIDDSTAQLTFENWNSPLGTAMTAPEILGTSRINRVQIFFMAAHWLVGGVDRLDLQVMSRPANG